MFTNIIRKSLLNFNLIKNMCFCRHNFPYDILLVSNYNLYMTFLYIIRDMLQSTDAFPLNFGFTGKGNSSRTFELASDLIEQVLAGAIG